MADFYLKTPIEYLKGVGPARGKTLNEEAEIYTYDDLLHYFPFRYIDKSKVSRIVDINSTSEYFQVKGKVKDLREIKQKRGKRLEATLYDDSGTIKMVWFKGTGWIKDFLKPDEEYLVYGKPNLFVKQLNFTHPEMQKAEGEMATQSGNLQPIYHSGEKLSAKGLNSKGIEKLVFTLLKDAEGKIGETLSDELISKYRLPKRSKAFRQIHFPENFNEQKKASWRLKFEEFFFLQLKLAKNKVFKQKKFKGVVFEEVGVKFNAFYKHHLPFELTGAQKKVLKEIRRDLKSGVQMNRLMQGDVGSGKTIVALFCMLLAIDNGYQCCMMAPTEILAQQHFATVSELLKDMNVSVALLTGSTKESDRKPMLASLLNGELNIIIGTHALIEDRVQFDNLGLAIIDEQHRFGVAQRARLWKKSKVPPHILVMTATPIPRTLAMTVYGDLDVSIIDELPPGRKPVKTLHRYDKSRLNVFQFLEDEIKKGRQVYIIYPLIEESEKMDYKDLMDGYESISRRFPMPDYQISIVHGRMKSADKEFEMNRFARGETQILVATTVIEVGVNVPNASVMVIESAERFGLSQLHQLRGRVGRGAEQSYCILLSSYKLSEDGKIRMETMTRTTDGFEISEADLQLRGPGDMMGTQQSGIMDLKIGNIVRDSDILNAARSEAFELVKKDVELALPENKSIRLTYEQAMKRKKDWSVVS